MLHRVSRKPLCNSCSKQLLDLFTTGFAAPSTHSLSRGSAARKFPSQRRLYRTSRRDEDVGKLSRISAEEKQYAPPTNETTEQHPEQELEHDIEPDLRADTAELRVQFARQSYGEKLPEGFLSPEEYKTYERLYGPPIAMTEPEDEKLLGPLEENVDGDENLEDPEQHALFKETEDGLEEVILASEESTDEDLDVNDYLTQQQGETADAFEQRKALYEAVAKAQDGLGSLDERTAMLQDLNYADKLAREEIEDKEMRRAQQPLPEDRDPPENFEYEEVDVDTGLDPEYTRTHPLTLQAESRTFPSTIRLPAIDFVEPIQRRLASTARYEHLIDHARNFFGGPHLPHSNATPSARGQPLQQRPIKLSAHQHNMSRMDANLFMATIMPGAYASAASIMVEIRKRLGPQWLQGVLQQPGGPRVLDAGAGGAAVFAWRELLAAEWDLMHENLLSRGNVPLGSSTVVAGSDHLREAVSGLLEDTSFIPRLPDFKRARDLPAERSENEPNRKQYDLVIAPYTLYGIEEEYIRKSQVQNLWSLVKPNGGVLIILEKGMPSGFEAVAEARDTLLKHHIRNPDPSKQEQEEPLIGNFHTHLEDGMIVAPCTTHNQCPMYPFRGETVGRKDFCSFRQRFERPPFLQRIRGATQTNHEDVKFSYIAVQRGKDLRKDLGFFQNEESTKLAFAGHEDSVPGEVAMLTLPRIVAMPLKRTGHVTLDVCTPHGKLERWTTPKSFSLQAYRDARKSRWGDLWALGAKTRVETPAKAGRPKDATRTKINFETGEVLTEEQEARKKENTKRKAARMRKAKLGRQPKYSNDTRKKVKKGEDDGDELD